MDGFDVTGIWKVSEERNTAKGYTLDYPSKFTFKLFQKSNKIRGTAQAEFINVHGHLDTFNYEVKGIFKDGFINLILVIQENKISPINFLLRVSVNGWVMKGFMSFYAHIANEVNSVETTWILEEAEFKSKS